MKDERVSDMQTLSTDDHVAQASTSTSKPFYLVIFSLLIGVGYIDYASGFEVSVFLLYGVPIYVARRWGSAKLGQFTAFCCAITWALSDVAAGHHYSQEWFVVINALNRLPFFLLVSWGTGVSMALHKRVEHVCTQCGKSGASLGNNSSAFQLHAQASIESDGFRFMKYTVCPECARRAHAHRPHGTHGTNPH